MRVYFFCRQRRTGVSPGEEASMIGLGTIINSIGIVLGGITGLLFGKKDK